jgi:hypothetical protein
MFTEVDRPIRQSTQDGEQTAGFTFLQHPKLQTFGNSLAFTKGAA